VHDVCAERSKSMMVEVVVRFGEAPIEDLSAWKSRRR
jgi:hypothetical protein